MTVMSGTVFLIKIVYIYTQKKKTQGKTNTLCFTKNLKNYK